jgi:hypothetical protein
MEATSKARDRQLIQALVLHKCVRREPLLLHLHLEQIIIKEEVEESKNRPQLAELHHKVQDQLFPLACPISTPQ